MKWNTEDPSLSGAYRVKGPMVATYERFSFYDADTKKWYAQRPGYQKYIIHPSHWCYLTSEEILKVKAKYQFN